VSIRMDIPNLPQTAQKVASFDTAKTIPDPVNQDDYVVTQYTHKDTVKGQSYKNLNCVGRWYLNLKHEKNLDLKTK
jgi:hypothetical protein